MDKKIELWTLFSIIYKRKWILLVITLLVLALGVLYSMYLVEPEYKSSTTLMVNSSKGLDITGIDTPVDISSLNLSQRLVITYIQIVKSRVVLGQVSETLELGFSYEKMLSMITVNQVEFTELLKIVVTDSDPERAQKIAENISKAFIAEITRILNVDNVEIVDTPIAQYRPTNDNGIMTMAISLVAGLMMGLFLIFFLEYNNRSITNAADVETYLGIHLIGSIPEYTRDMKRNIQL